MRLAVALAGALAGANVMLWACLLRPLRDPEYRRAVRRQATIETTERLRAKARRREEGRGGLATD